ncbi:putative uncharacterized protein DDB_G0290521 isoform X2 [Haliotis asinina]|uniref:putative uncharacterized protein DDB_G0290521 isoform X2 n=1 Tax=Haliotis asinina TaxID=109174 RepID=UPI0035320546
MEAPSNPVSLHSDRCYHSGRTYSACYATPQTVSEFDKRKETEKYGSAFLGPDLWDGTYNNADFSVEYMDLVDFLTENGFPKDHQNARNLNKSHSTNPQLSSSDHSPKFIDTLPVPSQSPRTIDSPPLSRQKQHAIDSPTHLFPTSDPQVTSVPRHMFCCSSLQIVSSQTDTLPNNGQQAPTDKFPKQFIRATPLPPSTFPCSSQVISSPADSFPSISPQRSPSPTDKYPNQITLGTQSPQTTFSFGSEEDIPTTDTFPTNSPQFTESPTGKYSTHIRQDTSEAPDTFSSRGPQLIPSPADKYSSHITQVTSVTPEPLPCSSQQTIPLPIDKCPNYDQQVSPSPPDTFPDQITRVTTSSPTTFPEQLPSLQSQLDASQCDKLSAASVAVTFTTSYSPVGCPDESIDLSVTQRGVRLVDFEGLENFDPRERTFSEDELKPQPMFKKSRKIFVPDDSKDDKYWCRRKKNNVAAKRSRDARRIKENQIAMRAAFLEKENSLLRSELEKVKKENAEILISLAEFEALET